jgi:hypothetical protein
MGIPFAPTRALHHSDAVFKFTAGESGRDGDISCQIDAGHGKFNAERIL